MTQDFGESLLNPQLNADADRRSCLARLRHGQQPQPVRRPSMRGELEASWLAEKVAQKRTQVIAIIESRNFVRAGASGRARSSSASSPFAALVRRGCRRPRASL
jgi:hypothetical protein